MSSPLDGLAVLTFAADANTPAELLPLVGKMIALPDVRVGQAGRILGVAGIVRQGTTDLEFLMSAEVPVPADSSPPWAQQLATKLDAMIAKLDQIIGGAAREADLQTALSKLDIIIGGAARQNTLNAVGAEVTAIKVKTGA